MPADSQNSDENGDSESVENPRVDWSDYHLRGDAGSEEGFEVRQRVFDPSLQPRSEPFTSNHQVLKDEERLVINHAPGRSEKSQSTRLATQDKYEITGRLCDSLDLHDSLKREAQEIMVELNLDKFGNQKRIAKIALVVIRHITDRARLNHPRDYPKRIAADERYRSLIAEQGMNLGDVMRLSTKVKQELQAREGDPGARQ